MYVVLFYRYGRLDASDADVIAAAEAANAHAFILQLPQVCTRTLCRRAFCSAQRLDSTFFSGAHTTRTTTTALSLAFAMKEEMEGVSFFFGFVGKHKLTFFGVCLLDRFALAAPLHRATTRCSPRAV